MCSPYRPKKKKKTQNPALVEPTFWQQYSGYESEDEKWLSS